MRAVKVPAGGFAEGYDAGLRDAKTGHGRALPELKRTPRVTGADWVKYRVGYDAGYFDGLIARERMLAR